MDHRRPDLFIWAEIPQPQLLNVNNNAYIREDDVCRALQDLQDPNGSSFSALKQKLCASEDPSPSQLRSLKLATARALQSGRIEQAKNGLRLNLAADDDESGSLVGNDGPGYSRKPYCSKKRRSCCVKKYTCTKKRSKMPFCSRYKVRCCKRRRKKCGGKPKKKKPKKPKKKKKSCGGKKKRKARRKKRKAKKSGKKCGKKSKPKKKAHKKKKCGKKSKPKPKPKPKMELNCVCG